MDPKTTSKKNPNNKSKPRKKQTPKKKKQLIVEKDPEDSNSNGTDEIKYSEKLKKLLNNIKSRSETDSDVRIRFAWKN